MYVCYVCMLCMYVMYVCYVCMLCMYVMYVMYVMNANGRSVITAFLMVQPTRNIPMKTACFSINKVVPLQVSYRMKLFVNTQNLKIKNVNILFSNCCNINQKCLFCLTISLWVGTVGEGGALWKYTGYLGLRIDNSQQCLFCCGLSI